MADQSEKNAGKVKETVGKVTGDDKLESEAAPSAPRKRPRRASRAPRTRPRASSRG